MLLIIDMIHHGTGGKLEIIIHEHYDGETAIALL